MCICRCGGGNGDDRGWKRLNAASSASFKAGLYRLEKSVVLAKSIRGKYVDEYAS